MRVPITIVNWYNTNQHTNWAWFRKAHIIVSIVIYKLEHTFQVESRQYQTTLPIRLVDGQTHGHGTIVNVVLSFKF